jgi:hypothetical protein
MPLPEPSIKITCDDTSYVVHYTNWRGHTSEIGYGDKHTAMEDHAQNLLELAAALNCRVELEKQ